MPPAPGQELQDKYVGKRAFLPLGDLHVEVTISKIRNRFGNTDARVKPVTGNGAQWIKADRLTGLHGPN